MGKAIQEEREVYALLRELIKVLRLYQNIPHLGGITYSQFNILDLVLEKGGGLELAFLHELLAVEKSTTTRLVNPLVKAGMIKRMSSGRDTRAIRLIVTEQGRAAHSEYWLCLSGVIGEIVGSIPVRRRKGIIEALRLFVGSIKNCCKKCC